MTSVALLTSSKFLSTPSARRATGRYQVRQRHFEFLSTPSARRATVVVDERDLREVISIHALREEGDEVCGADRRICEISIHALREEGDGLLYDYYTLADLFLSTPSARRATHPALRRHRILRISIHALREEGDCFSLHLRTPGNDFYPRPPRGGRRSSSGQCP